ncbi:hypothetical protein GGI15_002107 [Coemansia interrupta]|uniref:Uncharacterized protein n=1 Tax=Coemansia interrupta TaxID=1126814 RepID=A0A9W8HGZ2_9FUNG|nr:hypothetical protein GGI15_002107 [Coemansia interrupta]
MSRNSRRRRQRKRGVQEPAAISSADPRASAMTADSAYASVGGGPVTKGILATSETTQVEGNVLGQPTSHTVTLTQYTGPIDNSSPEAELSPELSKDTHDISRLDGDIDMQFFDVMTAHRKYIRCFVEEYIQKYFGSFYYRVAIRDRQASRLCQSLNAYFHARQSISDTTLLAAIEKKMAALDATYFDLFINASDTTQLLDLNSSDRHFHMSLLAAVQECEIYEEDANWPSADAYATAFFNRIIEDVQFILFEGHQGTFVEDRTTADRLQPGFSRVKDIAARITPFKRAYYLGILASMLGAKYIEQMGRRVFLERAQLAGYRPVPTDIDFDNNLSEEDLEVELGRPSSDHMRVLMNETKWLFASAAATLRAIELLLANLRSTSMLLGHISVEKYAQLFGEFITNNTTGTGGSERNGANNAYIANLRTISQTPDLDDPHKRLEALTRVPAENVDVIQQEQPHIQTRIDALELEVADIRKTMREMAGMHHDLREVLVILKSNKF